MPLNYQETHLYDLSGGITDKYIDSPLNKQKTCFNLIINSNNRLETRPGYDVFYNAFSAKNGLKGIWELNDDIIYLNNVGDAYIVNAPPVPGAGEDQAPSNTSTETVNPLLLTKPFFTLYNSSEEINGDYSSNEVAAIRINDQLIVSTESEPLNRPMRIYKENDIYNSMETGLIKYEEGAGHEVKLAVGGSYGTDIASAASQGQYIYQIMFTHEFYIGDVRQFRRGAFTFNTVVYNGDIGEDGANAQPITTEITGLVWTQLDGDWQRPSDIRISIYRTIKNGTTPYLVKHMDSSIVAKDTFYYDALKDEDLIKKAILVGAADGTNGYYPAPRCKFITVAKNTMLYGNVVDESEATYTQLKNRLYAGVPGSTDSVKATQYTDLEDEIVGLSSVNSMPIAFTKSLIYRIEGHTGTSLRKVAIGELSGVASNNSIVRTNEALYFIADNGIYVTDGFSLKKLPSSETLFKTIGAFIESKIKRRTINGTYDIYNNRIHWSITDAAAEDVSSNNKWFILDLKNGSITTGGRDDFSSDALMYYNKDIYRGDDKGYIYRHDEEILSDAAIDDTVSDVRDWERTTIPFDFESVSLDFGSPTIVKWVKNLTATIKSTTNYSLKITSNNDDSSLVRDMKDITLGGSIIWQDPYFLWGDPSFIWRRPNTSSNRRHFPKSSMRCRRKQVRISNDDKYKEYSSDFFGTATFTYTAPSGPTQEKIAYTLDDLDDNIVWPDNLVGKRIVIDPDIYSVEYNVSSYEDATYDGPDLIGYKTIVLNGAPNGNIENVPTEWEVFSSPTLSRIEIASLSISYAMIANEGNEFKDE